jgi:S-adenosylmethionine:tRNA ribosyltransferase-isomerase
MRLAEFDYILPKELIAKRPCLPRDGCRLMVLDRRRATIRHRSFKEIAEYLKKGDCLILNDTKVLPARLFGRRGTGGKVEIFLLEKKNPVCEALVRPAGRLKDGEIVSLEAGGRVEILGRGTTGRFVRFNAPLDQILRRGGHVPLPPYIDRPDEESDRANYQTVYASREGATASPTAGLHFTPELLEGIGKKGVRISCLTLHTSYGTFAPIKSEEVEKHKMREERFELPAETMKVVSETKSEGGAVFATGTTVSRVLEHCSNQLPTTNDQRPTTNIKGATDLYIYPGYKFRIVDHLITNFHLPKSTLLLLASAFAGRDFILEAYRKAVEMRYRFFSYGDAMLIL